MIIILNNKIYFNLYTIFRISSFNTKINEGPSVLKQLTKHPQYKTLCPSYFNTVQKQSYEFLYYFSTKPLYIIYLLLTVSNG